jgi:nucleoside-diphosphate-sugar epimerase
MAQKYLVTGGTGFLGSSLVNRLVREGKTVRVLDNNWRGDKERLHEVKSEVEFIQGDIRDLQIVRKAASGMDGIFHLAFINGTEFFYQMPELVLEVGVLGMMNVLKAGIEENIRDLFLASSSEVYQVPSTIPTPEEVPLSVPDPLNPRYSYGGGKIISELLAINYARKHFERMVIFRPHNVYGPDMGWEHVIPQFICRMQDLIQASQDSLNFPIQGTGHETRAFVYIDDFIEGIIRVFEKGKHLNIYNIGTQEEVSMTFLAQEIGRYFGKNIVIKTSESPAGSTPRRCPDIGKIKKLGYTPQVSLKEGIQKTAPWYIQNPSKNPISKEGTK